MKLGEEASEFITMFDKNLCETRVIQGELAFVLVIDSLTLLQESSYIYYASN